MRISQLFFKLTTILGLTGLLGLLRNLKFISHTDDGGIFALSRVTRDENNNMYGILKVPENLSDSDKHYLLDRTLPSLYSTTHHRIRGSVSFLLEDDNGDIHSHGTGPGGQEVSHSSHSHNHNRRDVHHRGIVKIGREHKNKWLRLKRTPSNITFHVGEEIGYVQDDRLVVDVNYSILSEKRLFGGSGRHCHLLKRMTLRQTLNNVTYDNVRGSPPSFLNVTADCSTLATEDQDMDEGRLIASLYFVRMAAAKAGVDFQFKCRLRPNDPRSWKQLRMQKAFVWFGGYQSSLIPGTPWPYGGDREAPTESEICSVKNLDEVPLDRMTRLIRNDARQMAVQLVGSNSETGRTHHLIPLDADPLVVPQLVLDDVTIYLPCDSIVLEGQRSSTWMHFSEYAKRIPKDVELIGILVSQKDDGNNLGRQRQCKAFSSALQTYMHNHLPRATVVVRDDDAMPVVYARITVARYSFVPSDDFSGIFSALGSFGQAYLVPSTMTHLKWLDEVSDNQGFENVHLVTVERAKMFSSDHHQHTGSIDQKLLDWLTTEPVLQP